MDLEEFRTKFSILIVDDNEENVYTLQNRLQRDGYSNLLIARNGFQALDQVKMNHVDLILLDIMMPEMSGIEVLRALKDQIISQKLRILMISSADSLENITECIKLGADDFLPKPFNAQILKVRISSCVEKSWAAYQAQILQEQIKKEKARYLEVLNAVFPAAIVKELTETNTIVPRGASNVAVIFADIVSFTAFAETHEPKEVVDGLQFFVETCEVAANKFHLEKIKTIGDAFMATAGMLERVENPVFACIQWASEVISIMRTKSEYHWELHIGVDIGDLICGVIGTREYSFDIWGQCVNTAARIVSAANPNTIFVSEAAWLKVADRVSGNNVGEFKFKGIEGSVILYQVDLLNQPNNK